MWTKRNTGLKWDNRISVQRGKGKRLKQREWISVSTFSDELFVPIDQTIEPMSKRISSSKNITMMVLMVIVIIISSRSYLCTFVSSLFYVRLFPRQYMLHSRFMMMTMTIVASRRRFNWINNINALCYCCRLGIRIGNDKNQLLALCIIHSMPTLCMPLYTYCTNHMDWLHVEYRKWTGRDDRHQ